MVFFFSLQIVVCRPDWPRIFLAGDESQLFMRLKYIRSMPAARTAESQALRYARFPRVSRTMCINDEPKTGV